MAKVNVVMPQMGESITEGTLTRWLKKVGDRVEREEILFEISTDKVDSEIPAPQAGIVAELLVAEGAVVPVNAVVAVISDEASASAPTQATAPASAPTAAAHPSSVPLPQPTDKISDAVASGAVSQASEPQSPKKSSPLVKKMAAEHNIDVNSLLGSGEHGRVTKQDLLAALQKNSSGLVSATAHALGGKPNEAAAPQNPTLGVGDGGVRFERVPMTAMRKKIAEHMVMSKRTSPHVTSIIEVDLQKVVDLRHKFKDKFEHAHGVKLSFMPFFLRAAVEGLKAVPVANASVDGDAILYKKDINLGVAVALDWGLIVPVIKNAQDKNLVGLGKELNTLAEKARAKKLAPDDVKGGTFSVSNFGGFGTVIGQPIINQPQVAIMGIGAMTKKPVVVNDAIAIHTTCYVVLTFDHRILDGADSGKFLSTVKNVLENWTEPIL